MKQLLITLLAATFASTATTAFCDNIDKIIAAAVAHGAHGETYSVMRMAVKAGMHYEPRDNSWTDEKEYHPISEWKKISTKWLYTRESGTVQLLDDNGEVHFMHYVDKRVLTSAGHTAKVNGRYVVQLQLIDGRWIDL